MERSTIRDEPNISVIHNKPNTPEPYQTQNLFFHLSPIKKTKRNGLLCVIYCANYFFLNKQYTLYTNLIQLLGYLGGVL
jgi:hypothetical protein